LLYPGELSNSSRIPIADNDIGSSLNYRANEIGNERGWVLIVSIGINDDIGPRFKRVVYAESKCPTEPSTINATRAHDMVNPQFSGNLYSSIGRAIVDYLIFNL
jgi:hypothetical protein